MKNEEAKIKSLSKFLSLVLRHEPGKIGLALDENGWASVHALLDKTNEFGVAIDSATLNELVRTNAKQRFAFSEDGQKIMASQGHSIDVTLGYESIEPPAILYHGTADKNLASILESGLHKRERQHVHLSADPDTARSVGQRHGKPVIIEVSAREMSQEGYNFYLSANGVWLTEDVPAAFLQVRQD